jgi:Mg-chelatase subunit ChlD
MTRLPDVLLDQLEATSGTPISQRWACHLRHSTRMLLVVAFCTIAVYLAPRTAAIHTAYPSREPLLEDLVFVTDDAARLYDAGCDAISVVDIRTGAMIAVGSCDYSPGQLAVNSDGSLIASLGHPESFLHVLRRIPEGGEEWRSQFLRDDRIPAEWAKAGAIAFTPDNRTAIIATYGGIESYELTSIGRTTRDTALASYQFSDPQTTAAEIVVSADSELAYVVATDGSLHIVRVRDLALAQDPLPYWPPANNRDYLVRRTYSSLAPDGRYLVINTADQHRGSLNVIDLELGTVQLVRLPGVRESWGVRFNYARPDQRLLAVHGRTHVAIYGMETVTEPELLAEARVPAPSISAIVEAVGRNGYKMARLAALAWSGNGDAVIANLGLPSRKEWRILEYSDGPPAKLTRRLDFDSCSWVEDPPRLLPQGYDVQTLHEPLNPPKPTPTQTSTTSPTPVASSTPTLHQTATASPTPTKLPRPTDAPRVVYLPLALKEHCDPTQLHADVALVIDASSSMLDPTREGRTKLAAAIEAVELFLGELNLPLDQAGVVQFNGDVELLQELTGDRSALLRSLDRIQVERQTRIDLGIQVAHEELKSTRRRPGNQAVTIVLTDGKANPVGPDAAVREAAKAKADKITVFTIGLGDDLDLAALEAMASSPAHFYRAPDAEDLAEIYSKIAIEIPCPAEDYWGRR